MDDLACLQQQIRDLGLRLRVESNRLLVRAGACPLSAGLLSAIQERKQDLVALLVEGGATVAPNVAPLTFRQEWHWRIMQEEDSITSAKYMIPIALMLEGTLDVPLLAQSIDTLVIRHEPLRTRFIQVGSTPMQQVDEPRVGQLVIEEVAAIGDADPEDGARNALLSFFSEPIALYKGPLFRAKLLRLSDSKHILAICIHHMITDVESLTQLFTELWKMYKEEDDDDRSQSPRRRFQFGDFSAWQRSSAFDGHEEFWNEKLRDARPVAWPADTESVSDRRFAAKYINVDFRQSFSDELQRLAQRLGVIPGLVLLGAYAVFITHWCKQSEFVIPFVTNGRTAPEHANAMGWFSYPLLVRLRVEQDLAFTEFTEYVAREFMLALEYADGGMHLLRQQPYISSGTLFRWATAVQYNDAFAATRWMKSRRDFDIRLFPLQLKRAGSDTLRISPMLLVLHLLHDGVKGGFAYRSDLFSQKRMGDLVQSMRVTFEDLIRQSNTRIGERVSCISNQ